MALISMRYLIDRGIDMTIKDYRWNSTAQGWAHYGKGDEKMASGWRRWNGSGRLGDNLSALCRSCVC